MKLVMYSYEDDEVTDWDLVKIYLLLHQFTLCNTSIPSPIYMHTFTTESLNISIIKVKF